MHDWLKTFHGGNQVFPASDIALKIWITLAVGLLVGFERAWSNKHNHAMFCIIRVGYLLFGHI